MLAQLQKLAPNGITNTAHSLHEALQELWRSLDWVDLDAEWQALEAEDEGRLTPADHRDLGSRYKALAEAADVLAPGLIDDLMRAEINRLARQRSRHLRRYAQTTLGAGKRIDDPPLLDRMAEDRELLRRMAADLAQIHNAEGPARGRPRDGALDDALEALADLFLSLTGLTGRLEDLDQTARQPFLRFADSALAPFSLTPRLNQSEALEKRWRRLVKSRTA